MLTLNDNNNLQENILPHPGRRDCGAHQPDDETEPISHRDPQNPGLFLASFTGETGLDRAGQGVERHLQKIA